jgi:hypothetical protein
MIAIPAINMVVPAVSRHRHIPKGESAMTKQPEKFAATYQFGKTIVHVVAPKPMSDKELQERIKEMHNVGWAILKQNAEKSHLTNCKSN